MFKRAAFSTSVILLATSLIWVMHTNCQQLKYDAKGKRDPFVPLLGSEKAKVSGLEDVVSVEDITLEGIAIGAGGKKSVVMNGEILKENERKGEVEVKEITNTSVTLLISGKEYTLSLSEEEGGQKR